MKHLIYMLVYTFIIRLKGIAKEKLEALNPSTYNNYTYILPLYMHIHFNIEVKKKILN